MLCLPLRIASARWYHVFKTISGNLKPPDSPIFSPLVLHWTTMEEVANIQRDAPGPIAPCRSPRHDNKEKIESLKSQPANSDVAANAGARNLKK